MCISPTASAQLFATTHGKLARQQMQHACTRAGDTCRQLFAATAGYDLDGQFVWQHELLVVELMEQQHLNALCTLALQSLGPQGA